MFKCFNRDFKFLFRQCGETTLKILGYLSLPVSVLYEAFVFSTCHTGLKVLAKFIWGEVTPVIDQGAWAITAGLVLLDGADNICLISPAKDAERFFAVEFPRNLQENLLLQEEVIELNTADVSCRRRVFTFSSAVLMAINFFISCCANLLPLVDLFGRTPLSVLSMIGVMLVSVAYLCLFSAADVWAAYTEIAKGWQSIYAKLWNKSRYQFTWSFIQGYLLTNLFYCVSFLFIAEETGATLFEAPATIPWLQILAVISTLFVYTSRHQALFEHYLRPFAHEVGDNDLMVEWRRLSGWNKLAVILRAGLWALLMGMCVGYFAYKYSDPLPEFYCWLMGFLCGGGFFSFLFRADWEHEIDRLSLSTQRDAADEVSSGIRWMTFLMNMSSQLVRGCSGITFFTKVLHDELSQADLLVLNFMVTLVVGSTNYEYNQAKLWARLKELKTSYGRFFALPTMAKDSLLTVQYQPVPQAI